MCTMRPPKSPALFQQRWGRGAIQCLPAEPCEHGRTGECDDCNEHTGAEQAEASVGHE